MMPGWGWSRLDPGPPKGEHPYTVLTFHTSGDAGRHYEDEAAALAASLDAQGHSSYRILDAGAEPDWRTSALLKPTALSWALDNIPTDIVWIDADARVRQRLTLFDDWPGGDRLGIRHRTQPGLAPFPTGTLYLPNTRSIRALAWYWARRATGEIQRHGEDALEGDQDVLAQILLRFPRQIYELPPAYVFVYDKDRQAHPGVDPVIEHMQASRYNHRRNTARETFHRILNP